MFFEFIKCCFGGIATFMFLTMAIMGLVYIPYLLAIYLIPISVPLFILLFSGYCGLLYGIYDYFSTY